jgi:hypothetical protein
MSRPWSDVEANQEKVVAALDRVREYFEDAVHELSARLYCETAAEGKKVLADLDRLAGRVYTTIAKVQS